MKKGKNKKIKLIDIFKEEEISLMQRELTSLNINGINDVIDKELLKSTLFKIIKKKINEQFLQRGISWLEKETINTQPMHSTNVTFFQIENDEMKRTISWLKENCVIKLKEDKVYQYKDVNCNQREISLDKVKEYRNIQIKEKNENSHPFQRFISISEDSISNIETPEFDIFKLENDVGEENTLSVISCYIFSSHGLYSIVNYRKFDSFLQEIKNGYNRANPYHNDLHAADITQSCMIYLKYANFKGILKINDIDHCAIFTSCIVHDFKHPGYNNAFLSTIRDPLAIRYNDISILENYHISQTFKLFKSNEACNIFFNFSNENYKSIRKKMIALVLATDMIFHFKQANYLKEIITAHSIVKGENRNALFNQEEKLERLQEDFMEIVIHGCDISNPTKPFDLYKVWANRVVEEFFIQGDKEKELGLPVSKGFDRVTTSLAQSQIGFMDFIVMPFFSSIVEIFPELAFLTDNVKNNTQMFKKIKEESEKEKKGN